MSIVLNIVIDLILLGIIAFGVYCGVKNGFVKTISEPFKPVFAIFFAYTCSGWFSELVVSPIIGAPIKGYVSDFLSTNLHNITPETAPDKLPTLFKMAAGLAGIDLSAIEGGNYIDTLVAKLSDPVVNVIALFISAIALYFLGKLLFALIILLVDKLFSGGIVGTANKVLGVVLNTFVFLLIAWAVAVVISIIFHIPVFEGNEVIWGFKGGLVYWLLNQINPIVLLLSF